MECHVIDRLVLIAFSTKDLEPDEYRTVEMHVEKCTTCRNFLENLAQEKADFLQEFPNAPITSSVHSEPKNRIYFPTRQLFALAATLILIVSGGYLLFRLPILSTQSTNTTRIKGATGISIYVKTNNGTAEVRDDLLFTPGEQIQFVYSCGGHNRFMLVSIDENGTISTYYPSEGDSSVILKKGNNIPLPNSIILDDYIGKELFVAVFSEDVLQVPNIRSQLASAYKKNGTIADIQLSVKNAIVQNILITKKVRTSVHNKSIQSF